MYVLNLIVSMQNSTIPSIEKTKKGIEEWQAKEGKQFFVKEKQIITNNIA